MKSVMLREKGQRVDCHADWPLFYMNDFSQLGVLVDRLENAKKVLEQKGYPVVCADNGCRLEVNTPEQLVAVCSLLTANQITCELADLVSCVYQG